MLCPCQSQQLYNECCKPYHENKKNAGTALNLMRSRYSAYAHGLAQYIYDTYHSSTQAGLSLLELEEWANSTHWLKLDIVDSTESTVTFSATYTEAGKLYQIKEHSRFDKEIINNALVWRYTDGDILEHIVMPKPKRNDLCPCGSLKKLKQCCGVKSKLL